MSKLYTSSEVASHNSRKSCWIVIKDNVYDVTSYLEEHPGGEDPLLDSAGMDATTAFEEAGHSAYAKKHLNKFKIGSLAPGERCARLRPRLWMSSGLPTTVYRCENDEKACDSNIIPSNRSSPKKCCSNRSTPSRSKSSLQKCLSKTETSKSIRSKSASSLKRTASKSTLSSKRSNVRMPVKPDPNAKSPPVPIPIPRVSSIVVPRSRRPARRPPPSGSKLKYALLALAIAIIAGVAYKKYSSS